MVIHYNIPLSEKEVNPQSLLSICEHEDIVLLVENKEILNFQEVDRGGQNALFYACHNKNEEMLIRLLNYGVDINHRDMNFQTPLIFACSIAYVKGVEILLNYNACIYPKDNMGRTALLWACYHNNVEMVNKILNYEKTKYEKNSWKHLNNHDNSNNNPLKFAILNNNKMLIKELLLLGSEIDYICNNVTSSPLHDFAKHFNLLESQNINSEIYYQEYLEIMNMINLYNNSYDINKENYHQRTPLSQLVCHLNTTYEKQTFEKFKLFILRGAIIKLIPSEIPYLNELFKHKKALQFFLENISKQYLMELLEFLKQQEWDTLSQEMKENIQYLNAYMMSYQLEQSLLKKDNEKIVISKI